MTEYIATDSSFSEKQGIDQESVYRQQIAIEFSGLLTRLKQFLSVSEDDFLVIGGKLHNYQNLCRKINDLAKSIIQAIGTDILSVGISEFGYLLNTIGEHLSKSVGTIEKDRRDLQNIHSKLSNIEDRLVGFDKIVKTLRMLGISAKVESARLNLQDGGFFILAETVDKMSGQIGERIKVIKRKSKNLLQQLAKSLGDLSHLAFEQEKQNTSFTMSTMTSLESFKQKNLICAGAIGEINTVGERLAENLRNIVESIQFHDITSQQLQHVCEVVTEVREKLTIDTEISDDFFSHIHDSSELQARQIRGTLEEFTNSVLSIIESLREVEKGTNQLFDYSRKIIGTDSAQSITELDMFERDLIFITGGLEKSLSIDTNLDTSIAGIVSIVTDLAKQIETIEEVGTEIELISLNARVKAAHLGNEGAALGVLAEEIQKLSIDAKVQTAETFEVLKTIDNFSGELRSEITSTRHEAAGNLIKTTIGDLNRLVASIKNVEKTALSEAKELDGIVKLFQSELQITVDNVTVHKLAEQLLVPVISGLNNISEDLRSRYSIESHRFNNTKEITRKYTMDSERQIHSQYTNLSPNFIERIISPEIDPDGLGENIELF